ncbi:MAG: hypothetical protein QNJ46_09840 [Leptolyngbyaceae cyanobacterium MO_188.B28]|nr:hypothetical protein [Leptolyngbyaceae cyanobacterium MO_188.B28]
MEPLVFFIVVLVVAISIGVFFENFALDVKSGRSRPPARPPRRPPPPRESGPGQTKIWQSQLMHAGDKRPKPKPSADVGVKKSGAGQASGAGQTKIWRAQKEYRPDNSPKPRPSNGGQPFESDPTQPPGPGQTKIWRAQKEYRPDNFPKATPGSGMEFSEPTKIQDSLWGEPNAPSQGKRSGSGGSNDAIQPGRSSQRASGNDAGRRIPNDRRSEPTREPFPRARQSYQADKTSQRTGQDRPIVKPGQKLQSSRRSKPIDPSRSKKSDDSSLDTNLGFPKRRKSSDQSPRRKYPRSYSTDDPTRIQYTDRLRPIQQRGNRFGASQDSNSPNPPTSRNPFQEEQPSLNQKHTRPGPSESFNPAAYEQTYIGPFLDEDEIEELKREVSAPPPDVVYQETFLGPLSSNDEVIEEIREDEIEELALEGDVQPFDATYFDQTYIGPDEGLGSANDQTYIGGLDNIGDFPQVRQDVKPLTPEEESTLIWRQSEEEDA